MRPLWKMDESTGNFSLVDKLAGCKVTGQSVEDKIEKEKGKDKRKRHFSREAECSILETSFSIGEVERFEGIMSEIEDIIDRANDEGDLDTIQHIKRRLAASQMPLRAHRKSHNQDEPPLRVRAA